MATILVVDDEKSIRRVLEIALAKKGYNVLTAKNGAEGIYLAQNNQIDLVITDIRMPGMDGNQVCKEIQGINANIKFIGISGTPWFMDGDLFDYTFTKPFSIKNG